MIQQDLKSLTAALAIAERRRRETQRLSGVGFWELNHQAGTLYWSEEIFAIYELAANTVEPDYELFVRLIHDEDRDWVTEAYRASVESHTEYNIRYRVKAGQGVKWIEARGVTFYDDENRPERSIGTAQNISEIMDAQRALEHLALHDSLTGLPNRKLFANRISQALEQARRDQSSLAILFIDLDNFKLINDHYGHDIGDEVLVGVAHKLELSTRSSDTFARLGGDEFVGLITGVDQFDVDEALQRVKKSIDGVYATEQGGFEITASIGVAIAPQDSDEPDELLRHADHAMYEAKEEGKSLIRYFDAKRHHTIRSRNRLLSEVETAIENDRFELYFQPRISLQDGSLAGAEALLRWFRPEGAMAPAAIIDAIVGSPLEWELDSWVMRQALLEAARFQEHGLAGIISLNVNPSTIENPRLPVLLGGLLEETQVAARSVEIEILEVSSIRSFEQTNEILLQCKALGISCSLDDFGTGYSSLTYFHRLPIDTVKVDRRFIETLLTDRESLALVKSILAIAKANARPVVAEGIERHATADALRRLGCDYGQGFGLVSPMTSAHYLAWAQRWNGQHFMAQMAAEKQ